MQFNRLDLLFRCLVPAAATVLSVSGIASAQSAVGGYEQARIHDLQASADCQDFAPAAGITVTARDDQGQATSGRIRVLVGNRASDLYIIGAFNDWGANKTEADHLHRDGSSPYYEGQVRELRHGMEYRLLLNGQQVLDPAALRYTATPQPLNAVFWDFGRPDAYKPQAQIVDVSSKPVVIAEGEVYSMAAKYQSGSQTGPRDIADTFSFIADSDLPAALYRAGYNAVELMPLTQTNDAGQWQFRYQTYGLYAVDSRYGTPDDFSRMVDAFNKAGVTVVVDSVLGHVPFEGNVGIRDLRSIGLASWLRPDGSSYFSVIDSPWGTKRWDFANPDVRNFLTDSITTFMCRYPLGGIRFDNVDGIHDYAGPGGGGPALLQAVAGRVRAYRPQSLLIGEMFGRNPDVPRRLDAWQGIGLGYTNQGDLFEFFRNNLQRSTSELDMEWLASALHSAWDAQEAPRIQYLTDHDEAGNVRGGATGSYVATLIGSSSYYQTKKTQAFASLALFSGSAYLDMPQMRLLQTGNFSNNNAVDWSLLNHVGPLYDYFTAASTLMRDEPAFAFINQDGDFVNHLDHADGKRVISIRRHADGHSVLVLINLGDQPLTNYRFGVAQAGSYQLHLDSDDQSYGGSGKLESSLNGQTVQADPAPLFDKPASLQLPYVGAYSTVVLYR